MRRLSLHVRGIALLSAGALGVHQLRFLAACGDARAACGSAGHEYLVFAGPLAGMLLAVALGGLLGQLLSGGRTAGAARRTSFAARWTACVVSLVAIFSAQELVEAALAPGRAIGVSAVFGAGGWWALVFALLIGALVALALKGAETLVAWAGSRRRLRPPLPRPVTALATFAPRFAAPSALHVAPLGARAPPAAPLV
jgi:hypothetical protein